MAEPLVLEGQVQTGRRGGIFLPGDRELRLALVYQPANLLEHRLDRARAGHVISAQGTLGRARGQKLVDAFRMEAMGTRKLLGVGREVFEADQTHSVDFLRVGIVGGINLIRQTARHFSGAVRNLPERHRTDPLAVLVRVQEPQVVVDHFDELQPQSQSDLLGAQSRYATPGDEHEVDSVEQAPHVLGGGALRRTPGAAWGRHHYRLVWLDVVLLGLD
mmetsp:Transcript_40034/g.95044  ORF Transcript_40034/g.95044 Transcript_40034/m.95044 type:complete len:218 (-) Transcript_40034:1176-1829(-)